MPRLLVLADDMTGAAEIGGAAFMHGLSVKIIFELNDNKSYPEDVIIVDSNSRSLKPEQAFDRISGLISNVNFSLYDLVFKKVDSVLRGPVISEIKALLSAMNLDSAFLVPANPAKNRIIRSGKYYINGIPINQTGFRDDPEYPRLYETIQDLITDSSDIILTGSETRQAIPGKITIPDITSKEDMHSFVSKIPDNVRFLAGASDFFNEILASKIDLKRQNEIPAIDLSEFNYFIIGTNTESSKETINRTAQKGYCVLRMPLPAAENEISFNRWKNLIRRELNARMQLVVTCPPRHVKDHIISKGIAGKLADIAKMIIETGPAGSRIFIEGGETASLFFRLMAWDDLKIVEASEEGAVSLTCTIPGIRVSVKPGSYKWPKNILE